MMLENKLNITNQVELAKAEEKISKQKAKQLSNSDQAKSSHLHLRTKVKLLGK